MQSIPQKELRNQVGAVLRRVEAGETVTITVSGRPAAELGPVHRRRWISGPALQGIWQGAAPQSLDQDLPELDASLLDPFGT